MHVYLQWALGCGTAYLFGSIPFGFLVAKAKGIDIRKVGSGNIGATNVFRCVSKPMGILTFLLDLGKGLTGCTVIPWLASVVCGVATHSLLFATLCGVFTVVGHNWTIFLGFRGGKGIATSAGLLLGLAPFACGCALGAWAIVFLVSRYVSLASVLAAVTLAIIAWPRYLAQEGWWFPVVLTALALVAILRHRANIRRLCAGTESRFTFSRKRA